MENTLTCPTFSDISQVRPCLHWSKHA